MKPLNEQISGLAKQGYLDDAARAKVAHDIVLIAMHRCGFKANSTIKGGVVMSSLTGDVRRATMDMDIDFMHYSIESVSVERFVARLAKAVPEMNLKMIGDPVELKHADYRGRRIYLSIKDESIPRAIRTKIDIGVHSDDAIEQIEFAFGTNTGEGDAELLANSQEQIFAEKLLSLLRYGANSNRPKDIFDMYYLSGRVDKSKLKEYLSLLVYANPRCRVSNHTEMADMVKLVFSFRTFVRKLNNARANWLQLPAQDVLNHLINFIEGLNQ